MWVCVVSSQAMAPACPRPSRPVKEPGKLPCSCWDPRDVGSGDTAFFQLGELGKP